MTNIHDNTISNLTVAKEQVQKKIQISFCKIIKNKWQFTCILKFLPKVVSFECQ